MRDPLFNLAYGLMVIGFFGFLACFLISVGCALVALVRGHALSDRFIRRSMNACIICGRLILAGLAVALIGGWLTS
jgi:hypothetical protein